MFFIKKHLEMFLIVKCVFSTEKLSTFMTKKLDERRFFTTKPSFQLVLLVLKLIGYHSICELASTSCFCLFEKVFVASSFMILCLCCFDSMLVVSCTILYKMS